MYVCMYVCIVCMYCMYSCMYVCVCARGEGEGGWCSSGSVQLRPGTT